MIALIKDQQLTIPSQNPTSSCIARARPSGSLKTAHLQEAKSGKCNPSRGVPSSCCMHNQSLETRGLSCPRQPIHPRFTCSQDGEALRLSQSSIQSKLIPPRRNENARCKCHQSLSWHPGFLCLSCEATSKEQSARRFAAVPRQWNCPRPWITSSTFSRRYPSMPDPDVIGPRSSLNALAQPHSSNLFRRTADSRESMDRLVPMPMLGHLPRKYSSSL